MRHLDTSACDAARPHLRVSVAGLGAIGLDVARALDRGIAGLSLVAVSAGDPEKARSRLGDFGNPPPVCTPAQIAEMSDIVVEAVPAAAVPSVVVPALDMGRVVIVCSSAVLLTDPSLIERARAGGARILVPSGAILGLDALRATAEGRIEAVSLETRKPPAGLAGAPHIVENAIDLDRLTEPTLVFDGSAIEAARGFPANVNVAASLALAGLGAERTRVRIWADPTVRRNVHTVRVSSDSANLMMSVEGLPSSANPRTSRLTAYAVISCLRRAVQTVAVGT